jgi:hypothetical protein
MLTVMIQTILELPKGFGRKYWSALILGRGSGEATELSEALLQIVENGQVTSGRSEIEISAS